LGYAVVEEVISPDVRGTWVRPLQNVKDPIDALIGIVQGISVRPKDVCGGCQLNNLAQEMSPLDAGFRKRLKIAGRPERTGTDGTGKTNRICPSGITTAVRFRQHRRK
jgi:hypothetical protein